ncbi:M14 family metallopeptidase [Echinimonas agarilytica]|uniref:M14-type cytosolic carboxypeptidase n=1 Tax=Echinimonas agarilytica TaxID=1215918 RepID=A0AA42B689_9GAMM|nr:M14-type cytosolic carboxypeptidase [Echinimonas agarilytica]
MSISSHFDGGNIEVLDCSDPSNIQLNIRKDNNSDFYQWFYFRINNAANTPCKMVIQNAAGSSYTEGWENYEAVASYDREHWFRVDTRYEDGQLVIQHEPEINSMYFAYFAPYSMDRHADLIAYAASNCECEVDVIGQTLDGRDMDLLTIGDEAEGKLKCWVIGRQHPGETMAEWWMEGFLGRMLDESDPVRRELLETTTFYVIPNMNPDGSFRGHLRTNAAGANLNREWETPTAQNSPEVLAVRNKMDEIGVDFCFDVHGDEALPYNFIAGAEGIPSWTAEKQAQLDNFQAELVKASPDFQTEVGYPVSAPGEANMTVCTHAIAERFNCLAMTLEMPFKDTEQTPDTEQGWSPERCQRLGEACVSAIFASRHTLR